jgi:hypothetical protein
MILKMAGTRIQLHYSCYSKVRTFLSANSSLGKVEPTVKTDEKTLYVSYQNLQNQHCFMS